MDSTLTPASYGLGARVSIHPMTDRFVDVILGALDDAAPALGDLDMSTDAVSTFVGGGEQDLVTYLSALIGAAAARAEGAHLAAHVLLSRGCPGEVTCELGSGPWAEATPLSVPDTGVRAVAEWSLYPMLDGRAAGDHMTPIMAAIERARQTGLFHSSDHYVTRLSGDVSQILALVVSAWREVGATVQHVCCHLSLSINSPTPEARS